MKTLGRPKMKIQKTSKDFTVGEILFSCLEVSYLEENT